LAKKEAENLKPLLFNELFKSKLNLKDYIS